MATTFKLVCGASSLDLNNGAADVAATDYYLSSFTPQPGVSIDPKNRDTLRTVDTAVIHVKGTSAADMRTNLDAIDAFLENITLWNNGGDTFSRVYLQFAPDGAASSRQSQVYQVDVVYEENWIDEVWDANYSTTGIEVTLSITRDNFAEATASVAVPLTNVNGTNNTNSTLHIYNCNDGSGSSPTKRCNYAYWEAADIIGDLPGAGTLYLEPNTYRSVYYGIGWLYDQTEVLQYEGESFTNSSDQVDATCSGGYYTAMTANVAQMFPVSGNKLKGGWYWPVLRAKLTSAGAGITIQIDTGGQPQTIYPTYITDDFCLISLPPVKLPQNYNGLNVTTTIYLTTTINSSIDFIQFIPMDGGWRYAEMDPDDHGPDVYNDDAVLGRVYFQYSLASLDTSFAGPGLWLEPGKDGRLWILAAVNAPGAAAIDSLFHIGLTYRPRYRSL